jgi:malate dehydrogenase (oxaloacetate-decarboxylating)
MRVQIPNEPGGFSRLAAAIGEAGGMLGPLEIVESTAEFMTRDVTIYAADEAQVDRIEAAAKALKNYKVLYTRDRTFQLHDRGKIEVVSKISRLTRDELSMAYTPGVARVCRAIADNPEEVRRLTIKGNTVAIVTDGTAVLGLGNIGPEASLPVMEGKALLFKEFAGIDAFPIALNISPSNNDGEDAGIDELVETVARLEPVFGGVNLEDIAAPRCFEVEARLRERLNIPVFHDDQHGTAVVTLAALRNALRVVNKGIEDLRVVMAGAGAAGVAIAKMLQAAGVADIVACDRSGAIYQGRDQLDSSKGWMAEHTNAKRQSGSLKEVLVGADLFVGVSGPNLLNAGDLKTMAKDPIVFALANPDPEVPPAEAIGVAAVYATGRSDYPNQINNVLCYPGIFRGALDVGATDVTENMKLAAANAIATAIPEHEVTAEYIIPSVFNKDVVRLVASAVAEAAVADGVAKS